MINNPTQFALAPARPPTSPAEKEIVASMSSDDACDGDIPSVGPTSLPRLTAADVETGWR
jgi:hypothetical protein